MNSYGIAQAPTTSLGPRPSYAASSFKQFHIGKYWLVVCSKHKFLRMMQNCGPSPYYGKRYHAECFTHAPYPQL